MTVKLGDVIAKSEYQKIFDKLQPGTKGWWDAGDELDCLESCPYHSDCEGYGPSRKLCSTEWKATPVSPMALAVLSHILGNFDHYNQETLRGPEVIAAVGELTDLMDLPFEHLGSRSEAMAMVTVRLKQAEFKTNLMTHWKGCSLDIDIDDRYLVASHIVPWSKSNDEERVSKYNGLLLPSNYDFVFDRHLITFGDDGRMKLQGEGRGRFKALFTALGIDSRRTIHEKPYSPEVKQFMSKHRERFDAIAHKL